MNYQWIFGPAVVTNDPTLGSIVTGVNWQCVGYDDVGNNYKDSGLVPAPPPDPNSFLPFDQLDQNTVQNWVFSQVDENAVEADLLTQSQAVPTVIPFNF